MIAAACEVNVGQGIEPIIQGADSQTSDLSPQTKKKSESAAFRVPRLKLGLILGRWILLSTGLILTATISATLGATVALIMPLSLPLFGIKSDGASAQLWRRNFQYRLTRPVNILVMGIDHLSSYNQNLTDIFSGNSDTILLLRFDPTTNSLNMLSIPRDTQVNIPGIGIDKINDANVRGGAALAARVISHTLNNVSIDRYVRVSTSAFRELVDLLGGIEVFVPQPMQYIDETQKLNIDLAQGWQILNGEQAEQFARFRNDSKGDIGRVQRQQMLLKALLSRLSSMAVLPRLPQIVGVMQKYIDTNLSFEEILALVNFGLQIDANNSKMVMLPGRFSTPEEFKASYWIIDEVARDRIMREYFSVSPKRKSKVEKTREGGVLSGSPLTLKIAVQNASRTPGLARRMERYLEKQGFQNVYVIQDWTDLLLTTQIVVQKGDSQAAATLQQVLGLGEIEATSTGDLESDITIRVGEDWAQLLAGFNP
ncbi:MAG: LCP family protein [Oscillatoriaceae bacterium SKW80]|nr:LCP family protein [Oscillatoriaceae bacterium SKW80]